MRSRRPRLGIVAVLTAVLTFVAALPGAATTSTATPGPRDAARFAATGGPAVTLVTGDRVRLAGSGDAVEVAFMPGPGREDVGYQQFTESGDLYVVPHDATPLIGAGTLDRRLFNVSQLTESGYHDDARDDVPLLVSYADGRAGEARSRTLADGAATRTRALTAIGGASLRAAKAETPRFWGTVRPMLRPGQAIEHLWLDAPVRATTDGTVPQIGAPDAWEDGYTGDGVRVAVLDSGVDAEHPDLAGDVVEAKDFTGAGTADDEHGHGTHVAGIIAGDGTASDGRYRGVAPDADLVVGRVLNASASGRESWILAGMEWAAERASVVNMSLGSSWPDDGTAPLSLAVNRLSEQTGALFVVSSGNSGPNTGTIGSPASADAALTVGAVDNDDELAEFSSRGPRPGDNAVKPEITAPGVDVVAPRAEGSGIGTPVDESYLSMSGTSMAAPHVAGSAVLVAQAHPEWKAGRLKSGLTSSASAHPDLTVYEQGAGRVDVARAVRQPVIAEPAVLNFGIQSWPHDDDTPSSRTVTYTNSGAKPVTMTLEGALRGPGGETVEGMLTVTPAEVTISAGEQASATVTVDTTAGGPDGLYGGAVVATGDDGSVVRTALGVTQEKESYDVGLTVLGPDGEPVEDASVRLVSLTEQRAYLPEVESGTYEFRARKGRYYLEIVRAVPEQNGEWAVTYLVEPAFAVDRSKDVVFDTRETVKPRVELTDREHAGIGEAVLAFDMVTEWGDTGRISTFRDLDNVRVLPTRTEHENFSFTIETVHARPDGDGGFNGSPYQYQLRHTTTGRVPGDLEHRVADDDLAKVRGSHAARGPSTLGERRIVRLKLPSELTEYYTPGVPWSPTLLLLDPSSGHPMGSQQSTPRTFERGETTHLRWGTTVHGPAFPHDEARPYGWAYRVKPGMVFYVPLYSDGSGHAGHSRVNTGMTELYRNGELVGRSDSAGMGNFDVPPQPGSYRLRVRADRGELTALSRVIEAEWTFRDPGPTKQPAALSLLGVHFDADLGPDNRAEGDEPVRIPVTISRNGTAGEPELRSLRIEVSFDGGRTWRVAPHHPFRGERVITVTAPEGTAEVSLKAVAEDHDGNTVKQTILGAYPVA